MKKCLDGLWKLYIEENHKVQKDGYVLNNISSLEQSGYYCQSGTVPGNYELDLMREGKLCDLLFGANALKGQRMENLHLWYACKFIAENDGNELTFLHFEGVDTFADVYLNGKLIGSTDNMFIAHEFAVPSLKKGENELVIHIRPVFLEAKKHVNEAGCYSHMEYNSDSLHIRKAPHMYGWDIMPRILSGGLWRSVFLIEKKAERIEDIYLYTSRANDEIAVIALNYNVKVNGDFINDYKLMVRGVCGDSVFEYKMKLWSYSGSKDTFVVRPKLWWTKGMGKQNLYNVTAELYYKDDLVDTREFRFGIRHVELKRSSVINKDGEGEFGFILNGKPIFILGTNWVPMDVFHSRDKERYGAALAILDDTGCNMVRCWGGNVYETKEFFDYCDEHGIAVWQDFAMACAMYPNTDEFCEMIRKEATQIVKRYRQHPSIFIWSGDNECDCATVFWRALHRDPNENKLTRKVLPDIIRKYDPVRPFLPSSPYIDEFAYKNRGMQLPEDHLWGPRDYFKGPFYMNKKARFASEIGYMGAPAVDSIKKFISEEKLWPFSVQNDEWLVHVTSVEVGETEVCIHGEKTERNIMPYEYRLDLMKKMINSLLSDVPDSLEDFVLASQITQAEALKFFVELFRSGKPERTGIMWWNMLDAWPQFSDSVVDYYYEKKLAYYTVKRSQTPIALMFKEPENGKLKLVAVSDYFADDEITYTVERAISGEIVLEGKANISSGEVMDLAMVENNDNEFEFFIIKWKGKHFEGINHYLAGTPLFEYNTILDCYRKAKLL